jgi:hypothetical protein
MYLKISAAVFAIILVLSGCSKTNAPTSDSMATVTLKDGTTFSGSVTKSDTSGITLQSSTGESRTYPMTQVASVQYGDQASAQTPAPSASSSLPPGAPPPPSSQPAVRRAPPPARPAPSRGEEVRTIPAGTELTVRNNEAINSETASAGQTFSGVVARDVADEEGGIAIPRGSNATLVVRSVRGQGKIEGRSELALDVGSVDVNGRTYRLETGDLIERGTEGLGKNKRTGIFTGGGAALGGIIGAIAGGGKGAAIGAASGAAAGAGTQAVTRGKAVHVPSETLLSFKLEAPVRIRAMP